MIWWAKGVLLDLDGTLIHSLAAVERAWSRWAIQAGLDPAEVLPNIHGRRSLDSLRALAPHLDAESEDLKLRAWETEDTDGIEMIPGAERILAAVQGMSWGLVTSGTKDVAQARLRSVGIPIPKVAVYGGDVAEGKPDPAPYALGCRLLGLAPEDVLVFEDTEAGMLSGQGAGCRVVWHRPGLSDPIISDDRAELPSYEHLRLQRHGDELDVWFESL